jgi:hypothetical protein
MSRDNQGPRRFDLASAQEGVPLLNQPKPKLPPMRYYWVIDVNGEGTLIRARAQNYTPSGDVLFMDVVENQNGENVSVLVDSFAKGEWRRVREDYAHFTGGTIPA